MGIAAGCMWLPVSLATAFFGVAYAWLGAPLGLFLGIALGGGVFALTLMRFPTNRVLLAVSAAIAGCLAFAYLLPWILHAGDPNWSVSLNLLIGVLSASLAAVSLLGIRQVLRGRRMRP